jgi:5'-nucleotidase/UDP-sugar diphosphatase
VRPAPASPASVRALVLLVVVTGGLGGCASDAPRRSTGMAGDSAAVPLRQRGERAIDVKILLSSDEHGWLSPWKDRSAGVLRGGVHAVAGALAAEGYAADAPGWLLLSAGDMWTGPYETTVLEGAPMVAVMNELGYDAAAIGNHEFDFGQAVLAQRRRESRFPFLGANLLETATGGPPPWAEPWTVVDVRQEDGTTARVGVLGLACEESPFTADIRNMAGLQFGPYDHALERALPQLQAQQPDVIVVLIHDSIARVQPLIPRLRALGVNLVAAGHEHRPGVLVDDNHTVDASDDVIICNAGPYMRTMCRVDLAYVGGMLRAHAEKRIDVVAPLDAPAPATNPALAATLQQAEASAAHIGGEILVESTRRLERGRDGALGQLVVDSWLEGLPYAHAAITNAGGLRQDVEAGPLRLRDIVSALPFNNYLLVVDMTGAELREVIGNPESIVGGVTYTWHDEPQGARIVNAVFDREGKPIPDDARLKVVVNDFMYRGGDRYRFVDREPEETAVDWREPIYRSLRARKARGEQLTPSTTPRGRRE